MKGSLVGEGKLELQGGLACEAKACEHLKCMEYVL